MSAKRSDSECRSRHSKNVLSGSKKRCKLLIRCGREKLLRITVSTSSSPKRSTLLGPFQSRILPSWSVEGAKRKRFAWSPDTPTRAIFTPSKARNPFEQNSEYFANTAKIWVDLLTRSKEPRSVPLTLGL